MHGMCASPPGRARWRIKTDGLFRAGQGSPFNNPATTRRRRVVRQRPAQPPRVHPARDDHRAVDGVDHRDHRRLQWHDDLAPRASARRLGEDRRHGSAPPSSVPCRSTRSRCRTSAATASSPSRSNSWPPRTRSVIRAVWPRAWPRNGRPTRTAPSGRSSCARARSGSTTASPFTSADVVATMERLVAAGNSGLKGVLDTGGAVATDANTVTFTLVGANGNFPYLVSIYNAQTLITPADYVAGTKFDERPTGTGAWKLTNYDQATGRDVRPEPRLVGRPDAARRHRVHLLRRHRTDDHRLPGRPGRRHRPVRRADRARRCSTTRTSASSPRRRPSIARSGCAPTRASSPRRKSARRSPCRSTGRPLIQQLFKGRAELGNDHVIWQGYPYFDSRRPAAGAGHRQGQGTPGRRPAPPT